VTSCRPRQRSAEAIPQPLMQPSRGKSCLRRHHPALVPRCRAQWGSQSRKGGRHHRPPSEVWQPIMTPWPSNGRNFQPRHRHRRMLRHKRHQAGRRCSEKQGGCLQHVLVMHPLLPAACFSGRNCPCPHRQAPARRCCQAQVFSVRNCHRLRQPIAARIPQPVAACSSGKSCRSRRRRPEAPLQRRSFSERSCHRLLSRCIELTERPRMLPSSEMSSRHHQCRHSARGRQRQTVQPCYATRICLRLQQHRSSRSQRHCVGVEQQAVERKVP